MDLFEEKTNSGLKGSSQNIKDFFDTDYVAYASYDNLRKIASLVDGLKNSGRKTIFTILEDKITQEKKVANLSSQISMKTQYLHGETSLDSVIVNLARDYVGTNNINMLYPEGSFGTRFIPEPSASRYIYSHSQKYLRDIFKQEDDAILETQEFEGDKIEYKFYVPTLPMLLVNGSEGVSSGFAQKILPRNPKELKEIIINFLNDNELPAKIKPFYKGFDGKIISTNGSHIIQGVFKRVTNTRLTITELPIGYNRKSYIKVLNGLVDKKVIKNFKDLSNPKTDKFQFEIQVEMKWKDFSDDDILKKLKLTKSVTENYTVLDEENTVQVCEDEIDILLKYINVKMRFLIKRKEKIITDFNQRLTNLKRLRKFVSLIVSEDIVIFKKSRDEINTQMELNGFSDFDDLLRMGINNFSEDKIKDLDESIQNIETELKIVTEKTPEQFWIEDLQSIKL